MFRCIGRPREIAHDEKDEEGGARESGPPSRKGAVKRLTKQIKAMALKFVGAKRKIKPIMENKGHTDFVCISGGVSNTMPYESYIPIPTLDFTSSNYLDGRSDPRSSIGASEGDIIFDDKDIVTEEWIAEVEPGVYVTFVSFPHGANHLKKIHFSPEVTTDLQAKMWWAENYERILKLYKVQRYSEQALDISPTQENENQGYYDYYHSEHLGQSGGHNFHAELSMEPSITTTTTSYKEPHSTGNDREVEAEWMKEDENGIYITIRKFD